MCKQIVSCVPKANRRFRRSNQNPEKKILVPEKGECEKKESLSESSRANSKFRADGRTTRKKCSGLHTSKIQSRNQGVAGAAARATQHDPNSVSLYD